MIQIYAGLFSEGSTDNLFLEGIIKKTLLDVAYDCKGYVEIDLRLINISKTGLGFVDQVLEVASKALVDYSITILFIHTDADAPSDLETFQNKITPAIQAIDTKSETEYCKSIIAVVPIYETESWMLADKSLFKKHLNSDKSDPELNVQGHPETFSMPKERILEAIRISKEDMTKRQRGRGIEISELYQIIGQELDLRHLHSFDSYKKFKYSLKKELVKINLLDKKFLDV